MLTRRQKNSIRGVTAALTCSAMLAGVMIYVNISRATQIEPVVFSDILEGAVAYSDDPENNDGGEQSYVTLADDELMETMFGDEFGTRETFPDMAAGTTAASVTYIPPDSGTSSAGEEQTEPPEEEESSGSVPLIPQDPNDATAIVPDLAEITTERSSDTEPQEDTLTSPASSATTAAPAVSSVTTTSALPATYADTATSGYVLSSEPPPVTAGTSRTAASSAAASTASPAATTTTVTTSRTTAKTTAPKGTTTSKTVFYNVGGGTFSEDDSIYLTMFRLVNNARREAGLKDLWYSARVHDVCRVRTQELTSYYSHNRPDGSKFSTAFKDEGITYTKCGENIAYGRNMFKTPEEVFQAWMDSETHRENILDESFECCAFGLSVLTVGKDTYYYWSQEFAKF